MKLYVFEGRLVGAPRPASDAEVLRAAAEILKSAGAWSHHRIAAAEQCTAALAARLEGDSQPVE